VPIGKALSIGRASVYRVLEVGIEGPGAGSTALQHRVPKSCRACRSRSVAILAIAAAFTVLAATILPTGVFAATKLPPGTFTALKFPTVLTATKFAAGIFTTLKLVTVLTATKLRTVLATTILTTWATIALMIWASGGAQR
jgi:hypothetical protein